MKKLILALLIIALSAGIAFAAPFVGSDSQDGVEQHLFECGTYSVVTPAQADGSFLWDMATWPGTHGWFDCTVKAGATYEVEDMATGIVTEVLRYSNPAALRIKIPNTGSNSNYVVTE